MLPALRHHSSFSSSHLAGALAAFLSPAHRRRPPQQLMQVCVPWARLSNLASIDRSTDRSINAHTRIRRQHRTEAAPGLFGGCERGLGGVVAPDAHALGHRGCVRPLHACVPAMLMLMCSSHGRRRHNATPPPQQQRQQRPPHRSSRSSNGPTALRCRASQGKAGPSSAAAAAATTAGRWRGMGGR